MAKRKPPVSRVSRGKNGVKPAKVGPKAAAARANRPPRDMNDKGKKLNG